MSSKDINKQLVERFRHIYQLDGFVSENEALDIMAENNLRLDEIEKLTGQLLSMGILILSDQGDVDEDRNELEYERSQINYEQLFSDVVRIDPTLMNFIKEVRMIKPPQYREWMNLLTQAKAGNQYAYDRIIEMYLKVVIRLAFWFNKNYDAPLDECIQEGAMGLMRAIEKYETGTNQPFITYASWWIRQRISRKLCFTPTPLVYFPMHIREILYTVYDMVNQHSCAFCEGTIACPSLVRSVADELDESLEKAEQYLRYFNMTFSIHLLDKEEDSDFGALEEELDSILFSHYFRVYFDRLINQPVGRKNGLSQREIQIILLRYGLYDGNTRTLEEIGQIFEISRERVRQIEVKAFRHLRRAHAKLEMY